MKIASLTVEYLVDPIGIDIVSPRIRWTLDGCLKQRYYEVEYAVNGGEKKLVRVEGDDMYYDFAESFSSRDQVEFLVRSYADEGQAEKQGRFEMGLLHKEDWKASWISGDYRPNRKTRYPVDCFRKEFRLERFSKARLYISALGLYEARINGQRVGSFVLAPGFTDYSKRVQYQTYDVASLLKKGDNVIEVLLADGWYRGSIGAKGRTCTYGKQTAFIAQLETDGGELLSDEAFLWSNDGPIRFADLKDGEIVDFNKEPSFSRHAILFKGSQPTLSSSNSAFVEEHESFHPIRASKSKTGKTVLEFKQNLAGYLSFRAKAHKGDKLKAIMGEMLDENGDVTLKNIQCVNKGKLTPLQQIEITCKEGENEYTPRFFIAGFKYVSIESDIEINPEDFVQIALYTTIEETSSFECSNPLINAFYRNTIWSLKSNSADIPTDCPTRERMGWTGDSQLFFETASYITDYSYFTRKHLKDVFDRQWKNGKLPQIAPFSNEDWFMAPLNGSVGWADVGVLTPYRFYKKYGDLRILQDNYENMMRYARFMISRTGRTKGIYSIYAKRLHLSKANRRYQVNTGQSYGEWAEPSDVRAFTWLDFAAPHPEESMAYTSFVLSIMSEIAGLTGHEEDKPLLDEFSEGVKRAYQELVEKPEFSLDTDRQAKLVRPIYMHLLNEKQEEYAKKRLVEALDHYRWRLGTGFLSTPFILDVLADIDPEYAYRLLENEEMPGWLFMAKHDTGTIWEGWEGTQSEKGIASLNHYSKGAMVEWLFRGMCGIEVEGNNRFSIRPIVGGKIDHASAAYHSVYGWVKSSWRIQGGEVEYEISVPSNCIASFEIAGERKEYGAGTHVIKGPAPRK